MRLWPTMAACPDNSAIAAHATACFTPAELDRISGMFARKTVRHAHCGRNDAHSLLPSGSRT